MAKVRILYLFISRLKSHFSGWSKEAHFFLREITVSTSWESDRTAICANPGKWLPRLSVPHATVSSLKGREWLYKRLMSEPNYGQKSREESLEQTYANDGLESKSGQTNNACYIPVQCLSVSYSFPVSWEPPLSS